MNFVNDLIRKGYLISPSLLRGKKFDENFLNKL